MQLRVLREEFHEEVMRTYKLRRKQAKSREQKNVLDREKTMCHGTEEGNSVKCVKRPVSLEYGKQQREMWLVR